MDQKPEKYFGEEEDYEADNTCLAASRVTSATCLSSTGASPMGPRITKAICMLGAVSSPISKNSQSIRRHRQPKVIPYSMPMGPSSSSGSESHGEPSIHLYRNIYGDSAPETSRTSEVFDIAAWEMEKPCHQCQWLRFCEGLLEVAPLRQNIVIRAMWNYLAGLLIKQSREGMMANLKRRTLLIDSLISSRPTSKASTAMRHMMVTVARFVSGSRQGTGPTRPELERLTIALAASITQAEEAARCSEGIVEQAMVEREEWESIALELSDELHAVRVQARQLRAARHTRQADDRPSLSSAEPSSGDSDAAREELHVRMERDIQVFMAERDDALRELQECRKALSALDPELHACKAEIAKKQMEDACRRYSFCSQPSSLPPAPPLIIGIPPSRPCTPREGLPAVASSPPFAPSGLPPSNATAYPVSETLSIPKGLRTPPGGGRPTILGTCNQPTAKVQAQTIPFSSLPDVAPPEAVLHPSMVFPTPQSRWIKQPVLVPIAVMAGPGSRIGAGETLSFMPPLRRQGMADEEDNRSCTVIFKGFKIMFARLWNKEPKPARPRM